MKRQLTLAIGAALLGMSGAAFAITDIENNASIPFNLANPGARSMGMGGAFLGLADDSTAAYTNPAGLTQLVTPEVSAEVRHTEYSLPYVNGGSATLVSGQSGNHYTGCAADGSGNVYFVSMFAGPFPNPGTGSIIKLSAGGTVSALATGPLVFPNGITVGPDGALYVSVNSVCGATPGGACGPLTGGVVKITL